MCQDCCLVESPGAVPIQVEGDRKNPLAVGKHRQITAPDNFGKAWNNRGITGIFEPLDELPHCRFVANQRPGKIIARRGPETFPAELVSFFFADQFHAADPAEGPEQIPYIFPATKAKLAGTTGIKANSTYRTYRRKEQIHTVFSEPSCKSHCPGTPASVCITPRRSRRQSGHQTRTLFTMIKDPTATFRYFSFMPTCILCNCRETWHNVHVFAYFTYLLLELLFFTEQ
jgi:hypothetical protein